MPALYPAPQIIALNTDGGYIVNPVTGDSIQPKVNSSGDTLITGIPVPATGKVIHPDSAGKPEKKSVGKPTKVFPDLNIREIPQALTIVPLNNKSLRKFTPGSDTSSFVLVNSTGGSVSTGIPITIEGYVMPCIQPKPVRALPPHMKDNASNDLKFLDIEHGMNSSYVLSILEDSQGNLWFGTQDGGVSKYNGVNFTHFTKKEGLSDNLVYSILEDSNGHLWFGTYLGGVCKYDGEYFTHYTEKQGFCNNWVRSILEDSNGNLWFGTGGGGVSMFNGKTFTHFTQREGLSSNNIRSVIEDSNGRLWFATEGGGVSMYDQKTFTHFTEKEGLIDNMVYSILEDSQGNLWFGTENGACMFDEESFTYFTEKEGLSDNYVWSIHEDRNGNLWFGSRDGGVSLYNGDTFTHFTEEEGLSNNIVRSLWEDFHGNLWIGTYGGGVSVYNRESFVHITDKEGLSHSDVLCMLEDTRGNIWFGTGGGGLNRYNGEYLEYFTEKQGLSNNYIFSMLEDSHGNLWIGTYGGGINMYNGKTFTHFTEKQGLSNNIVRSILEDSHGNFWFGTWGGGVSMYNGKSFTHFTEKEGLSNDYVLSIMEDANGNILFGTYGGGVSIYDGRSFTHFTDKEGLSNMFVWSILEDRRGNLWFGTSAGVSVFDGESFTQFTEMEGIGKNIVYSITEDNNSNIWLSTNKGLFLLDFKSTDSGSTKIDPAIFSYSLQDGLKGMDYFPNSVLSDSKNRIWWGSGKVLTMLNLNNFSISNESPDIQLNTIEINEQFIDYLQIKKSNRMLLEFDGVARFFNYPLNLELPYNNNHLTFHFSAIDWTAPHKIKYSYKMVGLNNNWSLPTSEAKADYRSLPFGTYTFIVRAIGGAQNWSEPFEYTFTINPPWWFTWIARIIYAVVVLLLIFGTVRLRTIKLEQRQKELETEIANATQTISSQKEEVESQKEEIEAQRDEVVSINEALENQKRELEFAVENLKLTQSQLIQSEKMASVGVLTAGIAHELNNPINFISGNVNPLRRDMEDIFSIIKKYDDIIESRKLEAEFKDVDSLKDKVDFLYLMKEVTSLLEGIEEGADRSSKIVKGLRSFSRLDDEKLQSYDLHEGIDSTLILLHNEFKGRIQVHKEYGDLKEIECFPSKLNQVLMNILTNSIQAIEGKGEISIQTVSSGIGVKIIIKDSGIGMDNEIKDHIFEPFYTTKEVGQGTGLGLSITFGIIEQHKGNIDVISKPGKGTEFIISLPWTQSENG